jgi:hypothetical protein
MPLLLIALCLCSCSPKQQSNVHRFSQKSDIKQTDVHRLSNYSDMSAAAFDAGRTPASGNARPESGGVK